MPKWRVWFPGVLPVMKMIFGERSSLIISGSSNVFAKNVGGVSQGSYRGFAGNLNISEHTKFISNSDSDHSGGVYLC